MNRTEELLLIEALDALEAGQSLEAILSRHPEHAAMLRPALVLASTLSEADLTPTPNTVARARRNHLSAVGQAAEARGRRASARSAWPRLGRLSTTLAALLIALLVAGTGSAFAAGRALPGESLYPVKRGIERVRLALATDDAARQALIDALTRERLNEVVTLMSRPESDAEVVFSGPVEAFGDERWRVAGVELQLRPATLVIGMAELGEWVHVRGRVVAGRLETEAILYDSRVPFEPVVDPWPALESLPTDDPHAPNEHRAAPATPSPSPSAPAEPERSAPTSTLAPSPGPSRADTDARDDTRSDAGPDEEIRTEDERGDDKGGDDKGGDDKGGDDKGGDDKGGGDKG
ncbi:MAG: hypothetical protein KDH92_14910, partial [Chloroflexi bacterium]|nr:hypothetical protein [Chloroflexota bacterium]